VPERMGFAFSKWPVKTGNFEIKVHFRVTGEASPTSPAADQSFGVFYVEENVTSLFKEPELISAASWKEGLDSTGFSFSGGLAKFKGFGVVLSDADKGTDADKKQKPVVSYVSNDGTKSLAYGVDVPNAKAKAIDFRNTLNAAQLKIRVSPEFVEAHIKQSPSLSWQEIFRVVRADESIPVPEAGYIGITAWSGSAAEGVTSDLVSIIQVDMNNFDDTALGEDMKDVSAKIQEAYREMLTDENRHFVDQKSQADHLQRLTSMLSDHVAEARPMDQRLFDDLQALDVRMSRLDEDCRTLSKEFSILVNPAGGAGVGAVKDEIVGLRRLLVKDSQAHKTKVEEVKENVKKVKATQGSAGTEALGTISVQSEVLERTVSSSTTQSSWLLFCLFGCVMLIGGLMYKRMNYYERKHFI